MKQFNTILINIFIIFLIITTSSNVIGIQVFENVNENSTVLINFNKSKRNNYNNISENETLKINNDNNINSNKEINGESNFSTMLSSLAITTSSPTTTASALHETIYGNKTQPKMPVQYPKHILEYNQNKQSLLNPNLNILANQQLSHNKKRQLFSKLPYKKNSENSTTENLGKTNDQISSINSYNFIPSPQIDEYYENRQKPFTHNEYQETPPNFFQPIKLDAHKSHQTPFSKDSKWSEYDPLKSPGLRDLNKEYPKFDVLSKHIQQLQRDQEKEKTQWFLVQQHKQQQQQQMEYSQQQNYDENLFKKEKGKFVWVPEDILQPPPLQDQVNLEPTYKNGTGKWQWISDDANDSYQPDVESKIISHGPQHPTYFEQIKIFQQTNTPAPIDYPYSFDFGHNYGELNSGNNGNEQTFIVSGEPNVSSVENENVSKENQTENKEFNFFGLKGYPGGLAEMLFPSMNKGKEIEIPNDKKNSRWGKIFGFLTAAIPIGLLISSLAPQVVYINSNETELIKQPTLLGLMKPSLQRSLDDHNLDRERKLTDDGRKMSNPLMDFLQILGDSNNDTIEKNTICEDRVFCEIAAMGASEDAEVLNKMLWKIANETPEDQARKSGLSEIFRIIRENRCYIYECERLRNQFQKISQLFFVNFCRVKYFKLLGNLKL